MTIQQVESDAIEAYREFVLRGCCDNSQRNYDAFEAGWIRSVLQRTLEKVTLLECNVAALEATVERLETDHAERYSVN